MRRVLLLLWALLVFFAVPAGATPGGTDGNGGHTDSATGAYHYHHGYPAHLHINGVCPYDPNYTSNVITGSSAQARASGSEDSDDVVVQVPESHDGMFGGIQSRGQTGLIASGVALALISLGGFFALAQKKRR